MLALAQVPLPTPIDLLGERLREFPARWEIALGGSPIIWGKDSNGRTTWVRAGELSVSRRDHFEFRGRRIDYYALLNSGEAYGPITLLGGTANVHSSVYRWMAGAKIHLSSRLELDLQYAYGNFGIDATTADLIPFLYDSQGVPTFRISFPINDLTIGTTYKSKATRLTLRTTLRNSYTFGSLPNAGLTYYSTIPLAAQPSTWTAELERQCIGGNDFDASFEMGSSKGNRSFSAGAGKTSITGNSRRMFLSWRHRGHILAIESGDYDGSGSGSVANPQSLGLNSLLSNAFYTDRLGLKWTTFFWGIPTRAHNADASFDLSLSSVDFSAGGSYKIEVFFIGSSGSGSYDTGWRNVLSLGYTWNSQKRPGPFFSVQQLVPFTLKEGQSPFGPSNNHYLGGMSFQLGCRF